MTVDIYALISFGWTGIWKLSIPTADPLQSFWTVYDQISLFSISKENLEFDLFYYFQENEENEENLSDENKIQLKS